MMLNEQQLAALEKKKRKNKLDQNDRAILESFRQKIIVDYGFNDIRSQQKRFDVATNRGDRETVKKMQREYQEWNRVASLLDLH